MAEVFVAGVGMTAFGKRAESLPELMAEAAEVAVKRSGREAFDAMYVGVMNPEEFSGESNIAAAITDHLGLWGLPATRVETASATGAAALQAAFYAVASGYLRNVLVLAGEKMTHLSTSRTTRILAQVIERYERNCGASMPALAAMVSQRYMSQYKISLPHMQRVLAAVAIKNHLNGSRNAYAHFRSEISQEQYARSKIVSTPLRLYDCAPISDGAAAIILTSDPTDVKISGIGQGTDTLGVRFRDSFTAFRSTQVAAKKAYDMAGLRPQDVNFAEVHDAFTPFEVIGTEDLGLFEPGKGARAAEKGATSIEGECPVNPSGGLKARGHPVGASGLAQVVEIVWQLRHEVEPQRQVPRANIGLAQSTGGLANNNFVTILERADQKRVVPVNWESPYQVAVTPSTRPKRDPDAATREGVLQTYTVLYTTPEGFRSPLQIALIEDDENFVIMARGRKAQPIRIGTRVVITRIGETYYFFNRSLADKVRIIWRRKYRDLAHHDVVKGFYSRLATDIDRFTHAVRKTRASSAGISGLRPWSSRARSTASSTERPK
ncbi:MAG TPA: thiolase family protein [Candidatus Tectomicrobia bacterium]|jgi:acetyl-CoA C-acetyltransferase|nr:thiolase family protein [Candidatus Tectomicrobia bacterium]